MKKKWMVKLGTPILALAFVSACGPTNTNDNTPNNSSDTPQDINAPGDENPNYDNTRYNKQDREIPDNDGVNNNRDDDPSKYNLHNKLDLKNRR